MQARNKLTAFEQAMLPHLDAAHNLARWLTGNEDDAQDAVQEAYLRAFQSFHTFRGGDSRAWMLTVVRNACYTSLRRNRRGTLNEPFDDAMYLISGDSNNPEALVLEQIDREALHTALAELPAPFREVIVLREMEGLSYKEIAQVVKTPLGTVMSRLARARQQLQQQLAKGTEQQREQRPEL